MSSETNFLEALDEALDRPIAFSPSFLRIINLYIAQKSKSEAKTYGNAAAPAAAIFLSQAWYWTKRHKKDGGWFYQSKKEWYEQTALTTATIDTCRRILGADGMDVIEEKLKGVPATMNYRVRREKVLEYLIQLSSPSTTEAPEEQVIEGSDNKLSRGHDNFNRNTRISKTDTKPPKIKKQKRQLTQDEINEVVADARKTVDGVLQENSNFAKTGRAYKTRAVFEQTPDHLPLADALVGIFGAPSAGEAYAWIGVIENLLESRAIPADVSAAWQIVQGWNNKPLSPASESFRTLIRQKAMERRKQNEIKLQPQQPKEKVTILKPSTIKGATK
jgi:hypothetical protein